MPQLKVCGVKDAAFAICAEKRGVDFIGLVFAQGSSRHVTPGEAKAVVSALHTAKAVGVFTDHSVDEIATIASFAGLDVIQLHGPYSDADVGSLKAKGYEVWRLLGGNCGPEDAVLLDGRKGNKSGRADWSQVAPLRTAGHRVILAGSISEDNVADAVRTGADIIDVSGSLETAPGKKSLLLLERFLSAISLAKHE